MISSAKNGNINYEPCLFTRQLWVSKWLQLPVFFRFSKQSYMRNVVDSVLWLVQNYCVEYDVQAGQ